MKAIGYIRVSTEEQAKEGVSLENQHDKITAYCALNDLELIEVVEDRGISAKNLHREGIQKIITLIKKHSIDAVVVYKLDRLSRSVRDIIDLVELFEKNNIAFHAIVDHIDTKTATGRFFLNIMASLSQMERELIGERTKDALQMKIVKGERAGQIPYGYTLSDDGRSLVINENEQKAIIYIKALHNQGYSNRAICKELEKEGYCPTGKQWHHQTIQNILKKAA